VGGGKVSKKIISKERKSFAKALKILPTGKFEGNFRFPYLQ
jgi:hypothetical protein